MPKLSQQWPWPDSLDAVIAAPKSHIILMENDEVRVLRVVIEPGEKEPMHTHKWPSVMIMEQPARIRYYNKEDKPVFETSRDPEQSQKLQPGWLNPEGLHAVENIDTKIYCAIRIEVKRKTA